MPNDNLYGLWRYRQGVVPVSSAATEEREMKHHNHPDLCSHRRKAGPCLTHNWTCMDCGFGFGQVPPCKCVKEEPYEPAFGTHIKEAMAVVKDWWRTPPQQERP